MTNNLERRTSEHQSESIGGFTKRYRLTKLIFYEEFNKVEDAILAEKRIKGWIRKKKIDLIQKQNPDWKDLHEKILR